MYGNDVSKLNHAVKIKHYSVIQEYEDVTNYTKRIGEKHSQLGLKGWFYDYLLVPETPSSFGLFASEIITKKLHILYRGAN